MLHICRTALSRRACRPALRPLLAWLAQHGLFIPGKILLTAVVGGLIAWLYPRKCGKAVRWVALTTMVGVNL